METNEANTVPTIEAVPEASVLIVDDSEVQRLLMRKAIESMGMFSSIHEAGDGLTGFATMRRESVDIVLCDLRMPRCDGYGLLRLKCNDARTSATPVLMLTASDDVPTRVRVLEAGASDYVSKPARPEELRARLSVHLKLKQLHDELRHKTEELDRLAHTDTLTGIANRRHFDEALEREVDRSSRYRRPLSVVMIDLDHFKQLNDTHGHLGGDHALKAVADVLVREVRKPDLVARYGGEEFAVVLPETSARDAVTVAERIREKLASMCVVWEGQELAVTASMGVASCPSVAVARAEELLERADSALYAAKASGRNRVCRAPGLTPRGAMASGSVSAHN